MSILMVDDAPDNLVLLKGYLQKEQLGSLLTAASAQEAYKMLEIAEEDSPVDLILMDIMMPGISGIEACKAIKNDNRFRDIPVIMVSANTDFTSLEEAFTAGAMDYVTKPVRRQELMPRVRSAVRLKKAIEELKAREHLLVQRNEELARALNEIKTLRGFIPICAHCKKIRNLEGCWTQMELYFQQHSDLKFSHGICDHCRRECYPGIGEKT